MKAETKHTPGPWTIHNNLGRKGELGIMADTAPCIIAIMGNQKAWPVEAVANAQLIAAAPEMLAALEAVLESFVHIPGSGAGNKLRTQILARCENVKTALNQARAAIAKAKGST